MKNINCVATNLYQQRQVLPQTLMVLIHSLTIHTMLLLSLFG